MKKAHIIRTEVKIAELNKEIDELKYRRDTAVKLGFDIESKTLLSKLEMKLEFRNWTMELLKLLQKNK